MRIKKNKLYGSGALDMKSAILLFYFSILAYRKLDMRPSHAVRILLTPDEETGSNASTPYLLKTCKTAKAVILPEICCPDGGVKTQRKGVLTLKARLNGKAAHSGIDPEKGIDANRAVAKLILRIEHILADHPGIRFNPGLITGGTATNIVSPEAILEGELRAYSTHALLQAAEKLKTVDEIDGVTVNFRTELTHPALEFTPANRGLYEKAKAIADAMNYPLPTCSTGGSSDGSKLSAAGIPVIDGLGMRGAGAHSTQEYVELPDFPYRAALVSALTLEI